MPANERRFWWCIKGHIIGEVRKISSRPTGNRIRALMVYETSIACEADVPAELPPLRMRLIGDALEVDCTICHHRRDWFIGEDAFDQLMMTRTMRIKHESI